MKMKDRYERKIDYLRISLTDRCQLACLYCVPEEGVEWLAKEELLSDEAIKEIVKVFAKLGVKKIKLTGGTISRILYPFGSLSFICAAYPPASGGQPLVAGIFGLAGRRCIPYRCRHQYP